MTERDCAAGEACVGGVCAQANGSGGDVGLAPDAEPDSGGTVNNTAGTNNGADPCTAAVEVCNGEDDDCDGVVDEDVTNGCGGCGALTGAPGAACGECGDGVLACDGLEAVVCQGAGAALNPCGGCGALSGAPGQACGDCGQLGCVGRESLRCDDPGLNGCGGCGALDGPPGEVCGACGAWTCEAGTARCDDPGAELCQVRRFIAMGDTGEGNETQYRVSVSAQGRCDALGGCDGFLMLGDNIYDTGASSPTDAQFDEKIDRPYQNLRQGPPPVGDTPDVRPRMPIYVALGNHDLGGAGLNSAQVAYYLEYAQSHPWFVYPDEFWDRRIGNVHLISIHTNPMAYLGTLTAPQGELVQQVVGSSPAIWTVVFGHHPYRSNGQHGNAGSYEGIPGDLFFLGGELRKWVDAYVCNQVDFYVSGHEHNRQWMQSVPLIPSWPPSVAEEEKVECGTHFVVSGAGAKTTALQDRGNALAFAEETPGFLIMEFHHDRARMEFCDQDGQVQFERVFAR